MPLVKTYMSSMVSLGAAAKTGVNTTLKLVLFVSDSASALSEASVVM